MRYFQTRSTYGGLTVFGGTSRRLRGTPFSENGYFGVTLFGFYKSSMNTLGVIAAPPSNSTGHDYSIAVLSNYALSKPNSDLGAILFLYS